MCNSDNMLTKADAAANARAEAVRRSPYALSYHLAAPSGWINDPNGLVRFGGRYHVFYQHYPYAPEWGPMHWGHASSADLAHWRREPIALAPDQPYEQGCFSGSGVDDNGVLTLIYTAHDEDQPIKETQCIARSFDGGRTYVKSPLNPVIPSFPEGCSPDFRDPNVWKQNGLWHMVVGSTHGDRGCALLYVSEDLEHWTYRGILCESDGTMGNMWECPNFCHVDGQDLLIISPMEMPGHKNIVLFGSFNDEAGKMTFDRFSELDLGEDFYAAQVLYDGDRTLMIAWMDMWGKPYPTQKDGWSGALTIPRELHVRDGKLLQTPPKELESLRTSVLIDSADASSLRELHSDRLELRAQLKTEGRFEISDPDGVLLSVSLSPERAVFTLPGGRTSTAELAFSDGAPELCVFVDRCSVECFVNGGEVCFTQRIYPKDNHLNYALDGSVRRLTVWSLGSGFEDETC